MVPRAGSRGALVDPWEPGGVPGGPLEASLSPLGDLRRQRASKRSPKGTKTEAKNDQNQRKSGVGLEHGTEACCWKVFGRILVGPKRANR